VRYSIRRSECVSEREYLKRSARNERLISTLTFDPLPNRKPLENLGGYNQSRNGILNRAQKSALYKVPHLKSSPDGRGEEAASSYAMVCWQGEETKRGEML
jgi:hypothetical protein